MCGLEEMIEILREIRSDIRLAKYLSASIIAILLGMIIVRFLSP